MSAVQSTKEWIIQQSVRRSPTWPKDVFWEVVAQARAANVDLGEREMRVAVDSAAAWFGIPG